ncbi:hypothetical protein T439DRAFT_381703 [Meredithblackwellia eburnea MCA 4105]
MSGSTNATMPSLTGSPSDSSEASKASIWKYSIAVVIVVLAFCAIARFIVVRRSKRRDHRTNDAEYYPAGSSSNTECPPYSSAPNTPVTRQRTSTRSAGTGSVLASLLGFRAVALYDEEALANMSAEERERRIRQNDDIRRALQEAGLLLGPPASARREGRDALTPEEEEELRRRRQERRERRERRRQRRREEEEGAGLPAYTKEKGEGEKILESTGRDQDDEDSDLDEDSTSLVSPRATFATPNQESSTTSSPTPRSPPPAFSSPRAPPSARR